MVAGPHCTAHAGSAPALRDPLHEPSICSYPPEDVRIEAYGDYLKKRGKGLLAAERARVAPLVSGFGEGIDLRETIKNWMHDGRLYVREEQSVPGDVGAVCIVFDAEDRPEPDQLRLALEAFVTHGERLACVQARLTIDNTADSWLTRGIMAQTPQANPAPQSHL